MVRGRCGRVNNDNNVRQWHIADIDAADEHVRFLGGKADIPDTPSPMSANDPKRTFRQLRTKCQ